MYTDGTCSKPREETLPLDSPLQIEEVECWQPSFNGPCVSLPRGSAHAIHVDPHMRGSIRSEIHGVNDSPNENEHDESTGVMCVAECEVGDTDSSGSSLPSPGIQWRQKRQKTFAIVEDDDISAAPGSPVSPRRSSVIDYLKKGEQDCVEHAEERYQVSCAEIQIDCDNMNPDAAEHGNSCYRTGDDVARLKTSSDEIYSFFCGVD